MSINKFLLSVQLVFILRSGGKLSLLSEIPARLITLRISLETPLSNSDKLIDKTFDKNQIADPEEKSDEQAARSGPSNLWKEKEKTSPMGSLAKIIVEDLLVVAVIAQRN